MNSNKYLAIDKILLKDTMQARLKRYFIFAIVSIPRKYGYTIGTYLYISLNSTLLNVHNVHIDLLLSDAILYCMSTLK